MEKIPLRYSTLGPAMDRLSQGQKGLSKHYHVSQNWRRHHPEIQRERASWLGDRMAEIKAIEIRGEVEWLKLHGLSVRSPYKKVEEILEKYYLMLDKAV